MNSYLYLILNTIFLICVSFLTFSTQSTQNETTVPPAYCFQERPEKFEELNEECQQFSIEFCSNVLCEPLENCEENENTAIVQNITGRGCCPACVRFIDEDKDCEIRSKTKRCRNGLFCNPSTKKCNLPPKTKRCMKEVHNKKFVQENGISFYIGGTSRVPNPNKPMYFEMKYAKDIEYPTCAAQTGEYEPKQCRGSKCFCVDPDNGKFTFGLTVKDSVDGSSENVTCECAEQFRKTLEMGSLERPYMEHYAQIHAKCDSAGNYEKLQCINSTCFCVDEKTGQPLMEKVAIYGALLTLPCFDKDKYKALGSKDSDIYYQNECERQLMRTQQISLHFIDKGTDLIGLDKIKCSYDGKFAPKQCKPGVCNCVKPDDAAITTYSAERFGGKDLDMDCRCGRQIFYAESEKKGYDRPQCQGNGNYKTYQSFDNGLKTYCIDENGARISEIVSSACYDNFIKEIEPALAALSDYVCDAMGRVLTTRTMTKDSYFNFNFTIKDFEELSEKPVDEQRYCKSNSNPGCGCQD